MVRPARQGVQVDIIHEMLTFAPLTCKISLDLGSTDICVLNALGGHGESDYREGGAM